MLTEVCALLARCVGNAAALDFSRWGQRGGFKLDAPDGDSLDAALAHVLLVSERSRTCLLIWRMRQLSKPPPAWAWTMC